jgi:hypothetical protein
MEETVMGLMNLVTGAAHWGISNALPLAVGALLGSNLAKAALGLVSDMLGRAKGLTDDVTSMLSGKK